MGGSGSGTWYRWRGKKATVESCRHLDASQWMREGILKEGVFLSGRCVWFRDAARTEQAASIGYTVSTILDPPWVRLFYTATDTGEAVDYLVRLAVTRPHFGGCRWWFICPLIVNDRPCGRRVAKLYLRGKYFGCRHCHDLTYTSCQESHKVDPLERLDSQIDRLQRQTKKDMQRSSGRSPKSQLR